jgi:hypothetical protein
MTALLVYAKGLEAACNSSNAAPLVLAQKKDHPGSLSDIVRTCIAPHIPENRHACISEAAYSLAARRGFAPGHELEDWLEAEIEVDARLSGEGRAY